ncbi:DUF4436 family protein [Nakamurella sp.]|uniref:DUF4436 family protein n=1 Tax=Nakamurella sp. TaxID=1869182 RepID=UPI003784BB2E
MPETVSPAPPTAPIRARRRVVAGVGLAALVALYLTLVAVYAVGESSSVDQAPMSRPAGGVTVILTARTITAGGSSMHVDVTIDADDALLGDDGYPSDPITVSLDPTEEDADLTFDAGQRPQSHSATLLFDGDIQDWPFDSYGTPISAIVTAGEGPAADLVPAVIELDGSVQGWDLAARPDPDVPELLVDATYHRSPAIVLFGITLVLVLVLLPVTCWIVAWKLYREKRLFEAGFLGWIAALLFATIPIRNFFPGSPPPGSWVDVLVVLWVIVALTVGLLIGVAAFLRHPRPSP